MGLVEALVFLGIHGHSVLAELSKELHRVIVGRQAYTHVEYEQTARVAMLLPMSAATPMNNIVFCVETGTNRHSYMKRSCRYR